METVVKEAMRNGVIDPNNTPSLDYLRRVVRGHIKSPNPQKIEAAKALLSYEAPRWGERTPVEPPKDEAEILESIREVMSKSSAVDQLVEAVMGTPEGQQNLALAIAKRGYRLLKAQDDNVIQLQPAA